MARKKIPNFTIYVENHLRLVDQKIDRKPTPTSGLPPESDFEIRTCACGCKRPFKILKRSDQIYASKACVCHGMTAKQKVDYGYKNMGKL